jgi:hypothetical protein
MNERTTSQNTLHLLLFAHESHDMRDTLEATKASPKEEIIFSYIFFGRRTRAFVLCRCELVNSSSDNFKFTFGGQ